MEKLFSKFSFGRSATLLFAVMALALSGCLDKNQSDMPAPAELAYVNLYHGSPDGPDYNVLIDNNKANTQAFRYANNSGYFKLDAGTHQIAFTPVTSTTALIDTTFMFEKDAIYSLFTVGRMANTKLLVVKDSLVTPAGGSAAIRLVNLSPDAPALELVISGADASPIFTGIGFKGNTKFKEVVSGTYAFKVREAGTDNVLMPATNLELRAGRNYTLIVRGFQTPPSGNTNVLALQIIQNY